MSTYSIYIMQLYDSIYNLLLVVWVLTVSYLFVAYMNPLSLLHQYLKPTVSLS